MNKMFKQWKLYYSEDFEIMKIHLLFISIRKDGDCIRFEKDF